jgi:hypothetical protein
MRTTADKALDWVEVYAEARVAFPTDVWLRTEDEERGGVRITAYREEYDPPLPRGCVPGPQGSSVVYAPPIKPVASYLRTESASPWDEELQPVAHRLRTWELTYVVPDARVLRFATQRAARRWSREETRRSSRPVGAT